MEYVQMTLDDWLGMKRRLQQELVNMKQSFVRTGYFLRKIEDGKGYELDGYKSLAEFAKAEYGLSPSSVSRFKALNKAYSIDGYSEMIDPAYMDFKKSMLEEMLTLPEEDRQLISPEAPREIIRELKRYNEEAAVLAGREQERRETAEEGTEDVAGEVRPDPGKMRESFGIDINPKTPEDGIRRFIESFYKANPDIVKELFTGNAFETGEVKKLVEAVNPSGNRTYKKGLYFMVMYENGVKIKKFASVPQELGWAEFFVLTQEIFNGDIDGEDTYRNHFGEPAEEPTQTKRAEEKKPPLPKKTDVKPVLHNEKPEKNEKSAEAEVKPEVREAEEDSVKNQEPTSRAENLVGKQEENYREIEIAPAQKSLKEPGKAVISEEKKDSKSSQWETQARNSFSNLQVEMEHKAWKAALASTRHLLHYLELVLEAEGE